MMSNQKYSNLISVNFLSCQCLRLLFCYSTSTINRTTSFIVCIKHCGRIDTQSLPGIGSIKNFQKYLRFLFILHVYQNMRAFLHSTVIHHYFDSMCHSKETTKHMGPVVKSIVSFTSSLRGQLIKCLETL